MMDEKIVEHHQVQLIFHRILYGVLLVVLFIVYCQNPDAASVRELWVLIGTIVICAVETIISKFVFWNNIKILLITTYVQYTFYLLMIYLLHDINIYTTIAMVALLLSFMFEYSYYCDITDDLKNIRSLVTLVIPALLCMIIYFCVSEINISGFLMLLAYIMFCVMDCMIVRLFYLNEHRLMKHNNSLLARIDSMKNSTDELTTFQNRIQKVNEELNLQRVQLTKMNKDIQQSNSELAVQAELLKHINGSLSKDVPSFIEYIIDAIMRTRNVELCGIYIDRNVFYNKKPLVSFKCVSIPEMSEISVIRALFEKASVHEEDRMVLKKGQSQEFSELFREDVSSILVLPLILDDQKYGILVVGSKKRDVFDEHIVFYDVIVPQFNLAIHNIQMYEQMKHIAQTDGLTGINNRIHFNKLFAEQADRTIKNGESLTVALFDIDKFKRINDTYGHLVGDEVIKAIANLASKHVEEPEYGFICRYGGEEFVIVLPNKNAEQAIPIIEGLHSEIESTTVEAYGHIVSMTVSIGVTSYPDICDDVNQLLKRADWSMYYAKEHGRNQIKVDGPDVTEVK